MTPRGYWELNGGRPTVEGMLTKMQEREDAVTGTLLARVDPEIARLVVNLKAVSQMARRYLGEVAESFENEKATSTHLEEINVALVRQAIFHVLDGTSPRTPGLQWDFNDDEQRADFADQVISWLALRATPSATRDSKAVALLRRAMTHVHGNGRRMRSQFADKNGDELYADAFGLLEEIQSFLAATESGGAK